MACNLPSQTLGVTFGCLAKRSLLRQQYPAAQKFLRKANGLYSNLFSKCNRYSTGIKSFVNPKHNNSFTGISLQSGGKLVIRKESTATGAIGFNQQDNPALDDSSSSHDTNDQEPSHSFDIHNYRTNATDPLSHSALQLQKFYRVPETVSSSHFYQKLLRSDFNARAKAFNETAFMIRAPALEARELLFSKKNSQDIAPKVLLYGVEGSGKTIVFAQLLQCATAADYLIVCPVRQYLWNNYYGEASVSTDKAGRIDLPAEGAEFLLAIRQMNKDVFSKYGDELKTRLKYTWSKREVTDEGSPLLDLVTFGIERPKYSCDVIGAFLKELRLYSSEWPVQTLIAIDGVNSLFGRTRLRQDVRRPDKIDVNQISLVHHLTKLLSSEWKNGSALLIADVLSSPCAMRESHLPRYLLQERGFDVLNPFIPIEVPNYTEQEVNAALDYFVEMGWIQNSNYRTSATAREELIFLSNKNPHYLDRVTRPA